MTKTKTVDTIQNSSRQKQIAHGKNKSLTAKAKSLVSGRPSRWCNTTRSPRVGRFPPFFGNVVIMFCSKCGRSLKEIDNFCFSCGKGKFYHFDNHLSVLSTRIYSGKSAIFKRKTCLLNVVRISPFLNTLVSVHKLSLTYKCFISYDVVD